MPEAEPQSPFSKKGVFLFGDVQALQGLIPAHIQRPQNHGPALKGDQHLAVGQILLFLRREGGAAQIKKFGAEQPHAIGISGPLQFRGFRGGNVELYAHRNAIRRYGATIPVLLGNLPLHRQLLRKRSVVGFLFRGRGNDQLPRLGINNHPFPWAEVHGYLPHTQQRGELTAACYDGGM